MELHGIGLDLNSESQKNAATRPIVKTPITPVIKVSSDQTSSTRVNNSLFSNNSNHSNVNNSNGITFNSTSTSNESNIRGRNSIEEIIRIEMETKLRAEYEKRLKEKETKSNNNFFWRI